MTIHKEGYVTIILTLVVLGIINLAIHYFLGEGYPGITAILFCLSFIFLFIILQFFRHPFRKIILDDKSIIAPADGKVVVIEETVETEFLKDKRLQISIFMSPINVHVNRYPVSGEVIYSKYHPGLYLVAWHPKSSTENERTTVVIQSSSKIPVLMRQIAGALARRIVCYSKEGIKVMQGDEMGFIKFGSRVDLFLPLNCKIKVEMNQKVIGGKTVIAEFS
jgi:phosphatidylserine decarboxylase